MLSVVSPVVQLFPVPAYDEVNTTEPPSQNVSAPEFEMVGVAGGFGSFNGCARRLDVHPLPSTNVMLYDPAANPVIVYGSDTDPPEFPEAVPVQVIDPDGGPVTSIDPVDEPHVAGSLTVPEAIDGAALTVTTNGADVAEQPFASSEVTVYEPLVPTVIVELVSVVFQTFPVGVEEVKSTVEPAQIVAEPLAEIVGGIGVFTFTVV